MTFQEVYDLIESKLADNTNQEITEQDIRDVAHAILDRTNESDIESLGIEWSAAVTYAADELVTYLNRIWKSKAGGNLNHQPPADPEVSEDTWWIEQSRSDSSPIKEWAAGVYGAGLVIVFYNNELYKLADPVRPYNSTNFATELAAGDWVLLADYTQELALKADLVGGLVPANQLPSYVDDVLEYANFAAFPVTGETGKIYVDKATNQQYRWSGSAYINTGGVEIEDQIVDGVTNKGPSQNAVFDALALKISHSLTTAINDILMGNGTGQFIKKTLAEAQALINYLTKTGSNLYEASGAANVDGSSLVKLRITSTTNSEGWTSGAEVCGIDFYSADVSGNGAGVRCSIRMYTNDTTGSTYGLRVYTDNGAGLALRLTITPTGEIRVNNLTASRSLIANSNKGLESSAVTDTELGRVSGVTSPIQTQLDAKLDDSQLEDAIADGVTNKAPSQNAVYDALALKLNTADLNYLSADVSISAAELAALNTTPKVIVAAPGANKMIVPISMIIQYKHVSAAYSNNPNFYFRYPGEINASDSNVNNINVAGSSISRRSAAVINGILTAGQVFNKSLDLKADANAAGGGNGTMRVRVYYQIMDFN